MPTATLSEARRQVLGPYDRPLLGAATSPDWDSAVGTLAGNDRQGDLGRPVARSSSQPLLGGAAKSDQGGQKVSAPFAPRCWLGWSGFLSYGVSLVLFVFALRHLGTARTGAYFSTAPFLRAIAALALLQDALTMQLLATGLLMAFGVWLHVSGTQAPAPRSSGSCPPSRTPRARFTGPAIRPLLEPTARRLAVMNARGPLCRPRQTLTLL